MAVHDVNLRTNPLAFRSLECLRNATGYRSGTRKGRCRAGDGRGCRQIKEPGRTGLDDQDMLFRVEGRLRNRIESHGFAARGIYT